METIILFGASSDIASAAIPTLSQNNKLILISRDKSSLEEYKENHQVLQCDPTNFKDTEETMNSICKENKISGVVNFCGSIILKSAALLTEEEWDTTININLKTAFNIAHATTKYIKQDCSIIFFSTAAAHIGLQNHEAISAAKAGVEGLSSALAATYAAHNIRSNVICPGLVATKLSQHITKSEKGKALSESLHSLGRLGKPKDIASLLCWMLNPENSWITGESIRVDGGLSTTKTYMKNSV